MIWALLLACGELPEADAVPATVLDDPAYRFCHEAGLYGDEAGDFCALLEDLPEDRCPGLRESCAGAEPVRPSTGCNQDGEFAPPTQDPAAPPDKPPPDPMKCEPPKTLEGLGPLLRWTAAIVVALMVLGILRVLWAFFGFLPPRRQDGGRPGSVPIEPEEPDEDAPLDIPEGPGEDLLGAARRALSAGRFGDAVELARGAALRSLGEQGKLRLHRSRTDREYVRLLQGEEGARDALRDVVSAVELHRWGGRHLEVAGATRALEAASRLVKWALLLVVLASPRAEAQTPWRYSPKGDAGLAEVFERYGYEVSWRLRPLAQVGDEVDVVVVDLSGIDPAEAAWVGLRSWVDEGGVLVVAGDARPYLPEVPELVSLSPHLDTVLWPPLVNAGLEAPRWPDGPRLGFEASEGWVFAQGPGLWPAAEQTPYAHRPLQEDEWLPVITRTPLGKGAVIAIADERLLWNGAFVDARNEQFVGELLYVAHGLYGWQKKVPLRVQLATQAAASADGGAPNTPAGALANAHLLPFVLQMLLFWAVLALWRGWPFGPLEDPPGEGRQRFTDHVEAIARRYQRLDAGAWAWHVFARYWWGRLGPGGIEAAARRAGQTSHQAKTLVDRVRLASEQPEAETNAESKGLVEELWKLTRPA